MSMDNVQMPREHVKQPFTVADPEHNLGGVFSRPEGPSGEGTGGVSPPVGGGSGGLPRENFEKMMQNGAIWSVNKAF